MNCTKSIIPVGGLKSLKPDSVIRPTEVSASNISDHKLSVVERYNLLIKDGKSSVIIYEFFISDCGKSVPILKIQECFNYNFPR